MPSRALNGFFDNSSVAAGFGAAAAFLLVVVLDRIRPRLRIARRLKAEVGLMLELAN